MSYTETDLNRIEEAILKLQSGERVVSVTYDGHTVTYAQVDLKDLLDLRARIKAELSKTLKRSIHFVTDKDL